MLGWLAAKLLVAAVRLAIAWRYRRDGPAHELRWGAWYEIGLVIDGVVYGLIGTWLLPANAPEAAALMLATVIGVAAVGLIVLSARLRACLGFCVPVLLPPIVYQLSMGTRLSLYAAAAMSIFLALILTEGRRAAAATRNMLRLRFEMAIVAAQRQQALDLAQRHSAAKGQFLATMSHEMRTPLHGMLGLAALARAGTPQAERYLGMLEHTGRHLLGLINDVLDYSKIESGYLTLVPCPFDLTGLVVSVAELTRVSAAEKGLEFRLGLALPQSCWVSGDAARLRQVLLNLTGNAVKFTERGRIELRAHRETGVHAVFDVIDSGDGVPIPERERIFEALPAGRRLVRPPSRRHRSRAGDLARARAGDGRRRDLPRRRAGRGARASSCACRCRPPRPAPDAPPPGPPHALQGEVLLVEDNPVNALVAEAMLARAGLRVDSVERRCAGAAARAASAATTSC